MTSQARKEVAKAMAEGMRRAKQKPERVGRGDALRDIVSNSRQEREENIDRGEAGCPVMEEDSDIWKGSNGRNIS